MMIFYSREQREELFIEALELTTLAFEKVTEIEPHEEHWTVAINIRTIQCANAIDFHSLLAFQLHRRESFQFSCQQRVSETCVVEMFRKLKM